MRGRFDASQGKLPELRDENGYVLVAAMMVLLALTLFGIWGVTTSTFEIHVSGNTQQIEKQFNISEGGVLREAEGVGFVTQTYYEVPDPNMTNRLLVPTTDAAFDPGGDTLAGIGGELPADPTTWPMQNLLRNIADNQFDYRYLVAYLYPDTPPKGYDANSFSAYKFRMDGQSVERGEGRTVVEMGGVKVGIKASL